ENCIREFKDKVDWSGISRGQGLSEDFIREFQNKVNWAYISFCQNLSENFIREFQDKIDWCRIRVGINNKRYIFSEKFINEFESKLNYIKIIYPDNSEQIFCPFDNFIYLNNKISLNNTMFSIVEISEDNQTIWLE